ncbi:MAG TPA: hypothetical protein PLI68_10945 [Bacteroidia bacterium]|nr:hypothetical protein [Bacteroidia bacterium]
MSSKLKLFLLLLGCSLCFNAYSQTANASDTLATISLQDESILLKADELFDLNNFIAAMPLFDSLCAHYPQSVLFKFKTGICFLHASSKHDKALLYLQDVKQRKPDLADIDYYLGRAYLYNYYYDQAIQSFTAYAAIPAKKGETKIDVAHFIDYCNHGKEVIKNPITTRIDNIGQPVNTDNSEYVPVIASDESFMIFTYRGERSKGGKQNANNRPDSEGEYYEDIFISYKVGTHWLYPEPLGTINTNNHDAAIALSVDGQKLFVYKASKKDKGDIYVSNLNGYDWSTPKRLNKNINSDSWEGSISMSGDEKTIYFTSNRPGGFGGRDIYTSTLDANNDWGPAINLGPGINTAYNEDAPFIHPNNKLFYFSSEGHNSIGGYDIFKAQVLGDSMGAPENIGFPVNTSTDDKYISISSNGAHAYYSSGVDEGLGQQDIYSITPGIPGRKPQIAVIKGKVSGNENPVKAEIIVRDKKDDHVVGKFYSNSATGNYLLILLPYQNYKITFESNGYKKHTEYIGTASLNRAVEVIQDIHLYNDTFTGERIVSKDTIGFIFSKLDEEISKLDSMSLDDDHLIALAREREEERLSATPVYTSSFRVATEATIKRILAQNYLLKSQQLAEQRKQDSLLALQNTTLKNTSQATQNSSDTAAVEQQQLVTTSTTENQKTKQAGSTNTTNTALTDAPTNSTTPDKSTAQYGVFYKVQIGAYRYPKNFKYPQLKEFGTAETLLLRDGITRFTMGNFETLAEAKQLQKKIIAKGIKDAWITATVNGERKLLQELKQPKAVN